MEIPNECKARSIGSSGINTPLLIPSFSSTAFSRTSDVRIAMDALKSQIASCSLISAFDISRDYVSNEIGYSDLVIVDSGNYERRLIEGIGCSAGWSSSSHSAAVDRIVPLTQIVTVNYDEPGSLVTQTASAKRFFGKYTGYFSDFLCKPPDYDTPYLDISKMEAEPDLLRGFDIIGVTEKELGPSVLERCKNLMRLRHCLDDSGLDVPLHVFGCFDPLNIVLLFLSGADLFDGLTWAKYVLRGDELVYPSTATLLAGGWKKNDSSLQRDNASQNLRLMSELMFRLRAFLSSRNYSDLKVSVEKLDLVKMIMAQARLGEE